jgi:hypothetical protein
MDHTVNTLGPMMGYLVSGNSAGSMSCNGIDSNTQPSVATLMPRGMKKSRLVGWYDSSPLRSNSSRMSLSFLAAR